MSPTTKRPRRSAERALTLLELVVVMAIVATLLGIGIGALRRLETGERQALAQVKDAMAAARLFAATEGAPASVVVDPERRAVYGLGVRAAGHWHFEDEAGTGWPVPASHPPGALDAAGALGSCLLLRDGEGLAIEALGAAADSPHGFAVELAVAPELQPRPMTVLRRPGSWSLELDAQDRLRVALRLVPPGAASWGPGAPVDDLAVHLPPLPAAPGRLTRVAVLFDGRRLHASYDGVRAAPDTLLSEPQRLASIPDAPLDTGEGRERFRGRLDELRLGAVVVGRHEPLPPGVALLGGPTALHLDARGRLDRAFHAGPVAVRMAVEETGQVLAVELGVLGTLRSWTEAAP